MTPAPGPDFGATPDLDDWFEAEILSYERLLMRYLRRAWPNRSDFADLRQEIYVRVYESAARGRPESPRSFLLSTARHLVVDRIRRERVVSIDFTQDAEALNVQVDSLSPERQLSARQELRRLAHAFDRLSADCRAVIWLRRVEGLSQREVAKIMGIEIGTVSSHLSRGLKTLAKVVLGEGAEGSASPGMGCDEEGVKQGGHSDEC